MSIFSEATFPTPSYFVGGPEVETFSPPDSSAILKEKY